MRRIKIAGLCLVAVFAMSAVVAGSASAAVEYGRCIKVATKSLENYDSAKCTKIATEVAKGNFKWYPAFGGEKPLVKAGFTAVLKPETIATLETKSGTKVTCKGLNSAGKYTGNTTVKVSKVDFNGCESGGIKCNTPAKGVGEISVKELDGELGVITKGATPVADKIGNVLWPTGGKPEIGVTSSEFVEFNCGGLTVNVRGAVISPVSSNAMKSIATVKFTATKGVQKPTKFLGGVNMYLESSFAKAAFEQSGQSATTLQTNEEKVEVRTV